MNSTRAGWALALFFFVSSSTAAADAICPQSTEVSQYTIRKGDTLGKIAFEMKLRPLWGPRGQVSKLASSNDLRVSDVIYPGQTIDIPKCDPVGLTALAKLAKRAPAENEILTLPTAAPTEVGESTILPSPRPEPESGPGPGPELEREPDTPHAVVETGEASNLIGTQKSRLNAGMIFGVTKVASQSIQTNRTASLLSDLGFGAAVMFEHDWSERFSGFANAALVSLPFRSTLGFDSSTHLLGRIEFGADYQLYEKVRVKGFGTYSSELLAYAPTIGSASFIPYDQVWLGLGVTPTLFHSNGLRAELSLKTSYGVSATASRYTVKSSIGYVGSLNLVQQMTVYSLGMKIDYERTQQTAETSTQSTEKFLSLFYFSYPM